VTFRRELVLHGGRFIIVFASRYICRLADGRRKRHRI